MFGEDSAIGDTLGYAGDAQQGLEWLADATGPTQGWEYGSATGTVLTGALSGWNTYMETDDPGLGVMSGATTALGYYFGGPIGAFLTDAALGGLFEVSPNTIDPNFQYRDYTPLASVGWTWYGSDPGAIGGQSYVDATARYQITNKFDSAVYNMIQNDPDTDQQQKDYQIGALQTTLAGGNGTLRRERNAGETMEQWLKAEMEERATLLRDFGVNDKYNDLYDTGGFSSVLNAGGSAPKWNPGSSWEQNMGNNGGIFYTPEQLSSNIDYSQTKNLNEYLPAEMPSLGTLLKTEGSWDDFSQWGMSTATPGEIAPIDTAVQVTDGGFLSGDEQQAMIDNPAWYTGRLYNQEWADSLQQTYPDLYNLLTST